MINYHRHDNQYDKSSHGMNIKWNCQLATYGCNCPNKGPSYLGTLGEVRASAWVPHQYRSLMQTYRDRQVFKITNSKLVASYIVKPNSTACVICLSDVTYNLLFMYFTLMPTKRVLVTTELNTNATLAKFKDQ